MSSRRRVRRRRRPVVAVLLAALVTVGGVAVIARELRSGGRAPLHTSDVDTAATAAASAPGEPLVEESPSPEPTGPRTRFADGIWTVGRDLTAGRYTTTVPADVFACHWERLRDAKGSSSSTIAEGLGKPGTRVTVTIRSTDKLFRSELCGTWSPA